MPISKAATKSKYNEKRQLGLCIIKGCEEKTDKALCKKHKEAKEKATKERLERIRKAL